MSRPRWLPHLVLSLVFFFWVLVPHTGVSANLCRVTGGVLGIHWTSVLGLGWRPLATWKAGATCWQTCCLSPSCGATWSLGGNCFQLTCSRRGGRRSGCSIVYLPQPHQESLGLLQLLDKARLPLLPPPPPPGPMGTPPDPWGPVIKQRSVRSIKMNATEPSGQNSSSGSLGQSSANGSAEAGWPPEPQQKPPTSATASAAKAKAATPANGTTADSAPVATATSALTPPTVAGTEYTFDWHLITHPKDYSGEMEGKYKTLKLSGVSADTAILTLSSLVPGNYTFSLTVTDSDKAHSSTQATLLVNKATDYKPRCQRGAQPEGDYTFLLTVSDSSGQQDTAQVTVIVQPEQQGPGGGGGAGEGANAARGPHHAGRQQELRRPEDRDLPLEAEQVGAYEFTLTVTDERGLQSSDTVSVVVREEQDQPPVAHVLPSAAVALPHVLNGSDHQPVLFLGNLVEGKYTFILTVTDSKGQTSGDRGTLEVKPDPWAREEVELVLEVSVSQVTQRQRDMLLRQVGVLLGVLDSDIIVRDISAFNEHSTQLVFLVSGGPGRPPLSGHSVATGLRNKLRKQKTEFLIFRAWRVDTVICQLNCSGHGTCDAFTRSCVCQPFWMENFVRSQLGDGESNCEWSVLYVTIASFMIVVAIGTVIWGMVCCCRRRKGRVRRSKSRYKILEAEELELQPGRASRLKAAAAAAATPTSSALMRSDSDLDSDDGQGGVAWADRERGHLLRPQNGALRNGQGPGRGKKPPREELL
ncbi:hypothetical protein CRUP_019926 [Coryphaenoides rupestris]|nr:hypothetical protein CRUP_019926 [Coryphaenoides rupestris]